MTSNRQSIDLTTARVTRLIQMDAVPNYVVKALLAQRDELLASLEPVAWSVEASHDGSLCRPFLLRKDACTYANTKAPQHPGVKWTVVPLYRSPSTDWKGHSMTSDRRVEASLCNRHSWKVWWTQRLKKLRGKGSGQRLPYEMLTCRNCQSASGRWKR